MRAGKVLDTATRLIILPLLISNKSRGCLHFGVTRFAQRWNVSARVTRVSTRSRDRGIAHPKAQGTKDSTKRGIMMG